MQLYMLGNEMPFLGAEHNFKTIICTVKSLAIQFFRLMLIRVQAVSGRICGYAGD